MVMRKVGDIEFTAPPRAYDAAIDDADLEHGGLRDCGLLGGISFLPTAPPTLFYGLVSL
jgi:hypothetical protein